MLIIENEICTTHSFQHAGEAAVESLFCLRSVGCRQRFVEKCEHNGFHSEYVVSVWTEFIAYFASTDDSLLLLLI